ncbi:MAG: metalloregulator ArsR/SmtB family transcription factor [Pseudomonadota bacterium]
MTYDAIFTALADPTRRALLEAMRAGPQNVKTLAAPLPMSRPAVSQHLKVLCDAGLIEGETCGTSRLYRLRPEGLTDLRTWLDGMWDDALASFVAEAQRQAKGKLS